MQNGTSAILRFLGPLELVVDGSLVALGGPKQRALLAYLVLRADEPIPIETLVEAVWGDHAPHGAVRSLRTYTSNLRRLLGSGIEVRGGQGAYSVTLCSIETDIEQFRSGVVEAGNSGDVRETRRVFEAALDLWRGPFLVDVDRPWVRQESATLDAEHRAVVARWAEVVIEDGDPDVAIPRLDQMVSELPLDERLSGLLMRALYSTGRQADALAVYRSLRTGLAEELGVEPGPELMKLEEQILLHDGSIAETAPRWLVPAPASDLVGRSVEIEDLMARVQQARLLTLTGPGGVGKTRLAMEVGRRIIEERNQPVFFADLSAVGDESAVDAVLASSAGVHPHPDTATLTGLIEYLRPRTSLLIVDNCEHLAGTVARSIAALTRGCPELTILATSRSPLYVDGEIEWRTPSLALPDALDGSIDLLGKWPAVSLLIQRAPSSFQASDTNIQDIVELCIQLDGLPLALELAASRLGSMTPAEIVATLGTRMSLSSSDSFDESRHATLDATIGWSFDLLTDDARALLVRLGVMSGRFLLEDVLEVCGTGAEVPEDLRSRLSTLVDRSLVMAETSGPRTRYRLLETIRRFCLHHLAGEETELRACHADHFAQVAEFEGRRLVTQSEGEAVIELSSAHDNIRGAISWAMENGDTYVASRIVAALPDGSYWRFRNELTGWSRWAWEHTTLDSPLRWAVCGSAARGAWMDARFDDAVRFGSTDAIADDTVIAQCAHPDDVLADVALYRGDTQAALDHYASVVDVARAGGDDIREVWATYYVAVTNAVLGRAEEAASAAARSLTIARETRHPTSLAFALYANGLAIKHRSPDEAAAMLEDAVQMAASVENHWFAGVSRMELASVKATHGDRESAFRDFAVVIDDWNRAGDNTQLRHTWRYLVQALNDVGLVDEAAILAGTLLADTTSTHTHPNPRVLKGIEDALGEAKYARLSVRGSIMSVAELAALSLDAIETALAGKFN